MDMPEKIWAGYDDGSVLYAFRNIRPPNATQYTRSDIATQLAEALEVAAKRFELLAINRNSTSVDPIAGMNEARQAISRYHGEK